MMKPIQSFGRWLLNLPPPREITDVRLYEISRMADGSFAPAFEVVEPPPRLLVSPAQEEAIRRAAIRHPGRMYIAALDGILGMKHLVRIPQGDLPRVQFVCGGADTGWTP